jgi:hypothetical protein
MMRALLLTLALGLAGCGPAAANQPGMFASTAPDLAPSTAAATGSTTASTSPAPATTSPAVSQRARTPASAAPTTTAAARPTAPHTPAACGRDYYRNSDGRCVHRPVSAPAAPPGATAKCNDGTYSYSQHRRGTCSGHGGVAVWL